MTQAPGRPYKYTRFTFADFTLDPIRKELKHGERTVKIAPQPLTALIELVANSNKLVLRDMLKQAIWGEHTGFGVDDTLNHCIADIRKLLGDNARSPRYIETVARMGYRFIAKVSVEDSEDEPPLLHISSTCLAQIETDKKLLIEIARVRSQMKEQTEAAFFCDGVAAATLQKIHAMLGERAYAIDRIDSTAEPEHRETYHLHIWVQHRETHLRVNCHITEPVLRSVVQCAVLDVQTDEMLDAHDAVALSVVQHLLMPLLRHHGETKTQIVALAGSNDR